MDTFTKDALLKQIQLLSLERNKRMRADLAISEANKRLEIDNTRMQNIQNLIGKALKLNSIDEIYELTIETIIESYECENALFLMHVSENKYKIIYDFSSTFESEYIETNTTLKDGTNLFTEDMFYTPKFLNSANGIIATINNDESIVIAYNTKENINVYTPIAQSHIPSFQIIVNQISTILKNIKDKHELISMKENLNYTANHDMLTNLPNRVLFNSKLNYGIEKAKRTGMLLSLYFIDLDNFKIINDSFGHDTGDKILKAVTLRLKNLIRSQDTLARWGGDEFIIILEDLKDISHASTLAQKILLILQEPFLIANNELYVSTSIGISIYPNDSKNSEDLIKYADSAMYKTKENGKNSFQFYSSEMTNNAYKRVIMEASIRLAIRNEEFIVYYQPQIDANKGKLIGAEALVRWKNPNTGLIQPNEFIALAEEIGLMGEIDKLVMDIAMKQFSNWYKDGLNPGILSLNLSVKHLEDENYIQKLKESIYKHSLNTKYLVLELTESDIMKKLDSSIKKLKEIKELGINIAIDDFGVAYSSLSHLKKLPITELKIDKSFVDDIVDENDTDGRSIIKAIIAMADALDLTLIAEGVEDDIQKDFLVKNGCNIIQGYLYSKPLPPNEMKEFIKKYT